MIYKAILILTIGLFFSGCDKSNFSHIAEIDLPEHTPKLSAICTIQKFNSSKRLFISHSKEVLDTTPYKFIDNAEVLLYKDDELVTEFLWYEGDKHYYPSSWFSWILDSGDFEMEISAPGFETIQATQTFPINAKILNAEYKMDGVVDASGNVRDLLEVEIEDDGTEENFYSIGVSAEGMTVSGGTRRVDAYGYSDDVTMQNGWKEEFFPDETFNGGKYTLRYIINVDLQSTFELNSGGTLDEFNINVLSYTKDYYDFSRSMAQERFNANIPFTEPVIVPSNWVNGFGNFSLVNVEKFKLEL